MGIGSYKPPQSRQEFNRLTKKLYQWFWKAVFYFYALVILLAIIAIPHLPVFGFFDFVDFIISAVCCAAIFGYAYTQQVGSVVFWRYFFYIALIESFLFIAFFPLFDVLRYGRDYGFSFLEFLKVLLVLYILHQYAYRRQDIWRY